MITWCQPRTSLTGPDASLSLGGPGGLVFLDIAGNKWDLIGPAS